MSFESFWRKILKELREYEEEMDMLFREIAENILEAEAIRPMWSTDGTLEPLLEFHEEVDKYVIVVDLPYADMRSLSIVGGEGKIIISCKLKTEVKFEKWGTVQRRTTFREYKKVLTLPDDADVSNFKVEKDERKCFVKILVPKVK